MSVLQAFSIVYYKNYNNKSIIRAEITQIHDSQKDRLIRYIDFFFLHPYPCWGGYFSSDNHRICANFIRTLGDSDL